MSGNLTTYPYSFGINTNTLWYSVPNDSTHNFYVNGFSVSQISSTGLNVSGTINATVLKQNGVNLNSIITDTLTNSNYQPLLIPSCNIIINNVNLSNIYNSNIISTT